MSSQVSERSYYTHCVAGAETTCCPVFAVETVLQVNLCLPNQVIGSHQIPVVDGHGEGGIHRERRFNIKRPGRLNFEVNINRVMKENNKIEVLMYWLSKQRVELLRDVVLFVLDLGVPELDGDIWVGLPVDVCRMQFCCLSHKKATHLFKWPIRKRLNVLV